MSEEFLIVAETAVVNAPADRVYSLIADYREGHPRILPRQFHSLEVERGGVGAGTIIRCRLKVFGQDRQFRAEISEPEPGRLLLEKDLATGMETTFKVVPLPSGNQSEVTITTKMKTRPGLPGKLEHFVISRFLGSVYREELRILNQVAAV